MIVFSLLGLFLAEVAQLTALMTATAVGTVLSCIVLGSLFIPWIVTRLGRNRATIRRMRGKAENEQV
jgi:NhaP-type Na+/H+ or K+/H+ antiporter